MKRASTPVRERYEFLELVGEGAFGRVWRARDRQSGRIVAVKELVGRDSAELVRFHREVRILERLRGDPFVVELVDFSLDEAQPYLALEFCSGGSLRAHVGVRQDWRTVALAIGCAARGLHRIHAEGGFHRDIKPDNLLMTALPDGRWLVKVADFGIARTPMTNRPPMTRSGGGTDGYIAPEVHGGAAFTAAADVYSLGVTATELLVGSRNSGLLQSCGAPDALCELVGRMLEPHPSRRPSVVEVASGLRDLLQPRPLVRASVAPKSQGSEGGGLLVAAGVLALLAILASGEE